MFKNIFNEIKRYFPLAFIMAWAIWKFNDGSNIWVQLYQLSMVAFVVIAVNMIRQMLFPFVRFYELYQEAKKEPLASAIVIASFVAFFIAMMHAAVIK